jgi:hypothetical protein
MPRFGNKGEGVKSTLSRQGSEIDSEDWAPPPPYEKCGGQTGIGSNTAKYGEGGASGKKEPDESDLSQTRHRLSIRGDALSSGSRDLSLSRRTARDEVGSPAHRRPNDAETHDAETHDAAISSAYITQQSEVKQDEDRWYEEVWERVRREGNAASGQLSAALTRDREDHATRHRGYIDRRLQAVKDNPQFDVKERTLLSIEAIIGTPGKIYSSRKPVELDLSEDDRRGLHPSVIPALETIWRAEWNHHQEHDQNILIGGKSESGYNEVCIGLFLRHTREKSLSDRCQYSRRTDFRFGCSSW